MIVISRYKENFDWIQEYNDDYIIFNKGEPILNDSHIVNKENLGGNQKDIFDFIYDNYENLPEVMVFLQADPFPHCNKERLNSLIDNKKFTTLESYQNIPEGGWYKRIDGEYGELNNSWFLQMHGNLDVPLKYNSFDEFMNKYFTNYSHLDFLPFAPGSQYIIPKENALYYPEWVYKMWSDDLSSCISPREAHLIERSLFLIFSNRYTLKNGLQ